jgi:hypothetical protein
MSAHHHSHSHSHDSPQQQQPHREHQANCCEHEEDEELLEQQALGRWAHLPPKHCAT